MKNEPEVDTKLEKRPASNYSQQVGNMAQRKLKAQRYATKTVWSGLGMMGLIGWSVAIPTVLGALLGLWLDNGYPGGRSWTAGLVGCWSLSWLF
ncbi:hypothetical protein P4S72_06060 [Vibrio sp. PP-XX7]